MQARNVVEEFSIEQIVPYFQPIFDLKSHKVVRYECLARLLTKDDNIYLPNDFLYIVSRSQANAQLTQRILELSSAYCIPRNMHWSINMFQTDLRDANLMKWMQTLFAELKTHLAGVELSFESVKEHPHLLQNLLDKLPNIHVSIDDVDTFDDSFKHIVDTGVQAIKICGDMVTRYAKTGENKAMIEQIVEYCASQSCKLVAEHIEDDNALDAIQNLGIHYGQGYFLSLPEGRMTSLKQV